MILTEQNLKPEALLRFLKKTFQEIDWFFIDLYADDDIVHHIKKNSIGFYTVSTHVKSYPLEINLTETEDKIVDKYQKKIALALSEKFNMKTVIDFTHPDKPDEPFYSLLYDDGNCFLVDDSGWEENEEFIVLEPWES